MPAFRYRAARANGSLVDGVLESSSPQHTGALLLDRGLQPVAIELATDMPRRQRAARRADLAIVFRSIAALVSAGVPLERALASTESLARGDLRNVLTAARRRLREGDGLSRALAADAGVIPPVTLGLLRAGESGSGLPAALEEAASQLEREAELAGRLRQAMAYPCVLAGAGSLSVLVIGTVVLPRFMELLGDLGQQLPPTTRVLLATSTFVRSYGIALLIGVAALVVLGLSWVRTPRGRLVAHRGLLTLPVLGPVRHGLATARFGRALGAMLRSGMPLLPALQSATDAAGDAGVGERMGRVADRVARGEPLAVSLEQERALDPHAIRVIAVGESSGQLASMAQRAGDLAAREAERRLDAMVTLLEPALILVFGAIVALTAAALLQAVYSLRPIGA